MRTLRGPFIADFEEVDLDTALELEGARFQVDQVNWPDRKSTRLNSSHNA